MRAQVAYYDRHGRFAAAAADLALAPLPEGTRLLDLHGTDSTYRATLEGAAGGAGHRRCMLSGRREAGSDTTAVQLDCRDTTI